MHAVPGGLSRVEPGLLADGWLSGSSLFTARFLVQWLASERKRDRSSRLHSGGSVSWEVVALLSYAIFRRDPVIITGQAMGLFVYVRNLMLLSKARRQAAAATGQSTWFQPSAFRILG